MYFDSSISNQFEILLYSSNDHFIIGDDLPIHTVFFSISGSTYHHPLDTSTSRFRISITPPVLEHLHEVNSIRFLLNFIL
jgi:hypothetical protein